VNSDTLITVTVPPQAAATVHTTVTTQVGTSSPSGSDQVTYTAAPAPTITGIVPTAGPVSGGTYVTITGTNLLGTYRVSFGTTAASTIVVYSSTSILVVSPSHAAGTVDITATTYSGTSSTSSADQFTYGNMPTVTGLNPTTGPTFGGTQVTITGTNFTGATSVYFGTKPAQSFKVNSATQITATSPTYGIAVVDVTVTTPDGTSPTSSADQYTYFAGGSPPHPIGLTPSGPAASSFSLVVHGPIRLALGQRAGQAVLTVIRSTAERAHVDAAFQPGVSLAASLGDLNSAQLILISKTEPPPLMDTFATAEPPANGFDHANARDSRLLQTGALANNWPAQLWDEHNLAIQRCIALDVRIKNHYFADLASLPIPFALANDQVSARDETWPG
jgi:hypothetical protein